MRGQERARRALEIAAAGRHHLLMVGPPGAGKSMLAARLPGILPPLTPGEALETSMIHSLAGLLDEGGISRSRPFRTPHHTASMAAIVGGGRAAKPGEISLAHHGVLFLDELPEFPRAVLETLRQPIETGDVVVARANAHVRYPSRFLLVAAANPCRCGHLADPARACARAPGCGADYMGRISGPLMDRIDLRIEVPEVAVADLADAPPGEASRSVAARVAAARDAQAARFAGEPGVRVNADAEGTVLEALADLTSARPGPAHENRRPLPAQCPRLPPRPARRPHHRRSRRLGPRRPRPRRRSRELPPRLLNVTPHRTEAQFGRPARITTPAARPRHRRRPQSVSGASASSGPSPGISSPVAT